MVVLTRGHYSRRADMSLLIRPHDQALELFVNGTPVALAVRRPDIALINNDLAEAASQLVTALQLGLTRGDLGSNLINAASGLAARGHAALNAIFGSVQADIRETLAAAFGVPTIEVLTDEFLIPWEWLYDQSPHTFVGTRDLAEVTSPFWALNRIVSRRRIPRLSVSDPQIAPVAVCRPPTIGLILNDALQFALREREWLRAQAQKGRIRLRELPLDLGTDAWELIRTVNRFCNEPGIDILHLACHAESDTSNPLRSFLDFGHDRHYQIDYLDQSPRVGIVAPLVFLNACSTGVRRPLETFDFVQALWRHGATNVLAVEAAMESRVAADYAVKFYELLLQGLSLGEAVYRARRALIDAGDKVEDIVALFYSLYAEPFLTLQVRDTYKVG